MINNSNSNIAIQTLSSSINTNTLTLTNLNSSMNNINYHNINNSTSNANSITNTTINNNSVSNNNSTSTHTSNHFYNARSPTRRRSSLLSDITIESDEQVFDDIDAHTTDSNDSSWANNSALLIETVSRFSPIYSPGGNGSSETIEEEHYEYKEQLKQDRETCKASSATTAAPVIPRRRVSATRVSATFKG